MIGLALILCAQMTIRPLIPNDVDGIPLGEPSDKQNTGVLRFFAPQPLDPTGRILALWPAFAEPGSAPGIASVSLVSVRYSKTEKGNNRIEVTVVASYAGFQAVLPTFSVIDKSVEVFTMPYGKTEPEEDGFCEGGTAYVIRAEFEKEPPILHCHMKNFPKRWLDDTADGTKRDGDIPFKVDLRKAREQTLGYENGDWVRTECEDAMARDISLLRKFGGFKHPAHS